MTVVRRRRPEGLGNPQRTASYLNRRFDRGRFELIPDVLKAYLVTPANITELWELDLITIEQHDLYMSILAART